MIQEVLFQDLGTIEYGEAWKFQESLLFKNADLKKQAANNMSTADTQHHL